MHARPLLGFGEEKELESIRTVCGRPDSRDQNSRFRRRKTRIVKRRTANLNIRLCLSYSGENPPSSASHYNHNLATNIHTQLGPLHEYESREEKPYIFLFSLPDAPNVEWNGFFVIQYSAA